jgi:DNA-nicking Smr family endonuclease
MKRAKPPTFALRVPAGEPAETRRAEAARLKSLGELKSLRVARGPVQTPVRPVQSTAPPHSQPRLEAAAEFREAVRDVTPLHGTDSRTRRLPAASPAWPHPVQRERDNRAVLDESLADQIGVESLLETDESLSYRCNGISADTLRKLRRGFWVVQAELDLHGHRVAEAHHALGAFLRQAAQNGQRCVRIVHGKGHGSRDRVPVLKGKVRAWLARRSDVIAFCQARPADGGAGALLVLLRPSAS